MRRERSMSCGRARRLGFEPINGKVTALEQGRAARHLSQCPSCQAFEADMRLLASRIPLAAAEQSPSPTYVTHLRHLTSRPPVPAGGRYRWSAVLAAGLACLILITTLLLRGEAGDPLLTELVERRVELLAEPGVESADPLVVEQWITARTGLHIHVPTFDDARLLGATTTRLGGQSAAVIRFQVGSGYVTYATIATDGPSEPDVTLRTFAVDALRLVWWRDTSTRHVWSGSVSTESLTSFAHRCIEQAARVGG